MARREMVVRVEESTPARYKVAGGGIVALILWWIFFRKGGGGARDSQPLTWRLVNGPLLHLVGSMTTVMTPANAAARVKSGGRSDMILSVPGDVRTGDVTETLRVMREAGIAVYAMSGQTPIEGMKPAIVSSGRSLAIASLARR